MTQFALDIFPRDLLDLARDFYILGAREVLLVGGAVRDLIWYDCAIVSSDLDIEVHGLSMDTICRQLQKSGRKFTTCGKEFGVVKVGKLDISVPRRENKIGAGHRDFQVEIADMTIEEALSRRDFTVNAMAVSLLTGKLYDPFGGESDLNLGILRELGPAFPEDPVRVLRAAWMSSRFDLTPTRSLLDFCAAMDLSGLSKERLCGEWVKIAKSQQPSRALKFLAECGHLPPQIAALQGVPQDPVWHPEGDVFVHTCHVVDYIARIAPGDHTLFFAAMCHDFGKPSTTAVIDGRWRAHNHCRAGLGVTREFLDSIGIPRATISVVLKLVDEHLAHVSFKNGASDKAIRRLAQRLHPATIAQLRDVVRADIAGRPEPGQEFSADTDPLQPVLARAEELGVDFCQPQPLIRGRHVIDSLGIAPGPDVGKMVDLAFNAQLEGEFDSVDGGIAWLLEKNK